MFLLLFFFSFSSFKMHHHNETPKLFIAILKSPKKIHQQSNKKRRNIKCIISFHCAIKKTDIKEVQGIVAKVIEKKQKQKQQMTIRNGL